MHFNENTTCATWCQISNSSSGWGRKSVVYFSILKYINYLVIKPAILIYNIGYISDAFTLLKKKEHVHRSAIQFSFPHSGSSYLPQTVLSWASVFFFRLLWTILYGWHRSPQSFEKGKNKTKQKKTLLWKQDAWPLTENLFIYLFIFFTLVIPHYWSLEL